MNQILKFAAAILVLGTTPAMAEQCADPAWTKAITEAMGSPPLGGECDLTLYGHPANHAERVVAVRMTLTQIYRECYGSAEASKRKLPLRTCANASANGARAAIQEGPKSDFPTEELAP